MTKAVAKTIRDNDPTPNGGAYSEIVFLDEKGNMVDEKVATRCVIRECLVDGTLLCETYGLCK